MAARSPEKMMRAEEVLTRRVQAREGAFEDGEVEAELRKGGIEEWIAHRMGMAVVELGNPNGDGSVGKLGARVRRWERRQWQAHGRGRGMASALVVPAGEAG